MAKKATKSAPATKKTRSNTDESVEGHRFALDEELKDALDDDSSVEGHAVNFRPQNSQEGSGQRKKG